MCCFASATGPVLARCNEFVVEDAGNDAGFFAGGGSRSYMRSLPWYKAKSTREEVVMRAESFKCSEL